MPETATPNGNGMAWKVLASLGRVVVGAVTVGSVLLAGVVGYVRLCARSDEHTSLLSKHDAAITAIQKQQADYSKDAAAALSRIEIKLEVLSTDMAYVKREVFRSRGDR